VETNLWRPQTRQEPTPAPATPRETPNAEELLLTLTLAGAFLTALAIVKEALRETDDEGAISESVLRTVATADQYSEGLERLIG